MFAQVVKLRHEEGYWYNFESRDSTDLMKEVESLVLVKNNAIELLGEDYPLIKEIDLRVGYAKKEIEYIEMQSQQSKLLDLFLKGNNRAANEMCDLRREYQYEEFEIEFADEIE